MLPFLSAIDSDEDRDFILRLFFRYRRRLYAVAFKYLDDVGDSEDVVEDVFCMVAERCVEQLSCRKEKTVRRFLYACVKNSAINLAKKKKANILIADMSNVPAELNMPCADEPLEDIVCTKDRLERAKIEIGRLDPIYAEALWFYLMGYKTEETAAILGVSREAAKKRLYRAKQMLKAALAEKEDFEL